MSLNSATVAAADSVTATERNNVRKDIAIHAGDILTDTGAADAYIVTCDNQITSLATGQVVKFLATANNTGATTLRFKNSLALDTTKNIKTVNVQTLIAKQIRTNQIVTVIYDGTQFLLLSANFPYVAKGDLMSASADGVPSMITVGANNTIPIADSSATPGITWKDNAPFASSSATGAFSTTQTNDITFTPGFTAGIIRVSFTTTITGSANNKYITTQLWFDATTFKFKDSYEGVNNTFDITYFLTTLSGTTFTSSGAGTSSSLAVTINSVSSTQVVVRFVFTRINGSGTLASFDFGIVIWRA